MDKGYISPTVEFFEEEQLPEFAPSKQTIYGIIGYAEKGPLEPTQINSVSELHSVFGYAKFYLGEDGDAEKDADRKQVFSKAIASAERILKYTNRVLFQRVPLECEEDWREEIVVEEKYIHEWGDDIDHMMESADPKQDGTEFAVAYDIEVDGTTFDPSMVEGNFSQEQLDKTNRLAWVPVLADEETMIGQKGSDFYIGSADGTWKKAAVNPFKAFLGRHSDDKDYWVSTKDAKPLGSGSTSFKEKYDELVSEFPTWAAAHSSPGITIKVDGVDVDLDCEFDLCDWTKITVPVKETIKVWKEIDVEIYTPQVLAAGTKITIGELTNNISFNLTSEQYTKIKSLYDKYGKDGGIGKWYFCRDTKDTEFVYYLSYRVPAKPLGEDDEGIEFLEGITEDELESRADFTIVGNVDRIDSELVRNICNKPSASDPTKKAYYAVVGASFEPFENKSAWIKEWAWVDEEHDKVKKVHDVKYSTDESLVFDNFSNTETTDISFLIAPYADIKYELFGEKPLPYEIDPVSKERKYKPVDQYEQEVWEAKMKVYSEINGKCKGVMDARLDAITIYDYPDGTTYDRFASVFCPLDEKGKQIPDWEGPYAGVYDDAHCCTFYPTVNVANAYTGDNYEAPASGTACMQFAYSESKSEAWFAAAGFSGNRGAVVDAISCNCVLTKTMRDRLYANRVNPIANFIGKGIVCMGNTTFCARSVSDTTPDSVFCQISVRRLANYIRKIVIAISLTKLFDPNDPLTWTAWRNEVEPKLEEIKAGRGISDYKVKMDRSTISDEDLACNRAPGTIYVRPIGAIEYIPVHFVMTREDVYFETEEV